MRSEQSVIEEIGRIAAAAVRNDQWKYGDPGVALTHEDRTVVLSEDGFTQMWRLAGELLHKDEWRRRFSVSFVLHQLVPLLLASAEQGGHAAKEQYHRLLDLLSTYRPRTTVNVPVSGIVLRVDEVRIGRIRLYSLGEEGVEKLRRAMTAGVSGWLALALGKGRQSMRPDCIMAEGTFEAETKKAAELAEAETARSLDCLRYIVAAAQPQTYGVSICLEGEERQWCREVLCMDEDTGELKCEERSAWVRPGLEITAQLVGKMTQAGLSRLSDLLATDESALTDMQRSVLDAVHWFSAGERAEEDRNKAMCYFICLESLVAERGQEAVRTGIAECIAWLLGKDPDDRLKICKAVKDLYDARSAIVHGRARKIDGGELLQARQVSYLGIRSLCTKWTHLRNKKELRELIDRLKFGDAPPSS